jgi:ankyrin repeat protein
MLLSAAADPNAAAADGSTALHVAAAVDNIDAVQLLINAGACAACAIHRNVIACLLDPQAPDPTCWIMTVTINQHERCLYNI